MGASVQVFRQLCIMLLYMLVGYTLYKKKILTEAGSKELAAITLKQKAHCKNTLQCAF